MMIKTVYFVSLLILLRISAIAQLEPGEVDFFKKYKKSLEDIEQRKYEETVEKILRYSNYHFYDDYLAVINSSIRNNASLSEVTLLINPSSTKLTGKSYNQFIRDQAQIAFVNNASNEQDKNRFNGILANLVSSSTTPTIAGQVVQAAMSISPVTDLIGKVIGSVSSWISTTKNVTGISKIETAFKQDKITAFYNSLKSYVEFYDKTFQANNEFGREINRYVEEAADIQSKVNKVTSGMDSVFKRHSLDAVSIKLDDIKKVFPFDFNASIEGKLDNDYTFLQEQIRIVGDSYTLAKNLQARTNLTVIEYCKNIDELAANFKGASKLTAAISDVGESLGALQSSQERTIELNIPQKKGQKPKPPNPPASKVNYNTIQLF